jgi:hypothetical protein
VASLAVATAACESSAIGVGEAGQGDAAAFRDGSVSPESDAASADATSLDSGSGTESLDASIAIVPCVVGTAFLTCSLSGGGGCSCVSDVGSCDLGCDATGCIDYCAGAVCTNRCAGDQIAMACGGPPRPSPSLWDAAAPNINYVYADPPDGCAFQPEGINPGGIGFYCCPGPLGDR